VLKMLEEVEQTGDADAWVKGALDRGERVMGFGHRIYRAEDPRARVLRQTSRELGSPRFEAAEALESAALAGLWARRPDRVLATNVELWSAVILEQEREGKLIRLTAKYIGEAPRPVVAVTGI
jgi:citrate synthase